MKIEDDPLTFAGATRHRKILRDFWRAQGFDIDVRIEELSRAKASGEPDTVYCIRSNLVRGLPPIATPISVSKAA
jgi:hypothetical protein